MNEQQLQENNNAVKSLSFGIEGLLSGLVFVVLILITLNYFRIISLPSFYSKLSVLPQKELSVEDRAEKAGYKIIWKGSTEDGSGRAILASKERNYNGWIDKFGWNTLTIDNNKYEKYRAVGVFDKFEKINNSRDFYIIFRDPLLKNELRSRILINSKILELNQDITTRLSVENLDYKLKTTNYYKEIKDISMTIDALSRLIKSGDVVTVYSFIMIPEKNDKIKNAKIYFDEKGIPIAQDLMIRRFDGLDLN